MIIWFLSSFYMFCSIWCEKILFVIVSSKSVFCYQYYFLLAKFACFNLSSKFSFAMFIKFRGRNLFIMIRKFICNFFNVYVVVSILTNLLLSVVLTCVTNWSYRVFLTTSLSITLLSLLKTGEAVFSLSISISFLRIWSHLQKKSLMENFIFCAVFYLLQLLSKLAKLNVSTSVAPFKSDFVA